MSVPTDVELRHLDAIGLEQLTEAAALQTRVDRKYVLPLRDAELVLDAVSRPLADGTAPRVLEIDGTRSSRYESVYFDTPDLLSYRMAAHARRRRFKLRTRSYVGTEQSFLEMKTRGARSTTVKDRLEYDFRSGDTLTPDGREYTDAALDALGIADARELSLMPTLVTRYLRTTLYLAASSSRATIDTALSWEAADGTVLDRPSLVIIETKSGSSTSEVDRILWAHGHRPATISKFGTGLAALRSDLPSNKWARVLRRHFH